MPLQTTLTKAEITASSASTNAHTEYGKLTDPNTPAPSPPVHAARLSALLKNLSTAEGAVAESIKARKALIQGLEKLLKSNNEAIAKFEQQQTELAEKKAEIETKKRDVEDAIMRGLADTGDEPPRPEVEGLTPPPVESLTPTGTPPPAPSFVTTTGADIIQEQPPSHEEPPPQDPRLAARSVPPSALDALDAAEAANAAVPARTRGADAMNGNGAYAESTLPAAKKRKMSGAAEDDDFVDFLADGEEGIDADVTEMLGRD